MSELLDSKIKLSPETWNLLLNIVGDTGENEGADDVIRRIAKFYLVRKEKEDNKQSE